ncbi:MAG: Mur ligase protein [Patescibacteria group bacterium]|nr:Mur ligase protein [Patescibacteria group bacterium]
MKLHSIAEVEEALRPYFAVAADVTGKDITIDRTARLMAHLGNPEKRLRVIHIAGTSGKTSTTTYTAALLATTGKKIGHTISPHVESLNERVQINSKPISQQKFCQYMSEFLPKLTTLSEKPTWFEVMIGFTFWVFAEKEQVDYAVLETGLGGLQDSTNVTARSDKLCVLTDIGYDHTHILGDTLGSIAHQKAGIIHEKNVALMYEQRDEIMQVVRYWVSQQEDADVYTFQQSKLSDAYKGDFVHDLPEYQKRNWLLAWAAYRFIARRDSLRLADQNTILATQNVVVPSRMERHNIDGKTVVLDGAHNQQKMTVMVKSFRVMYSKKKPVILMALKEGKEVKDIVPILADFAQKVIVTTFHEVQDLPFRCMDPAEIATEFQKYGYEDVLIEPDTGKAWEVFAERTSSVGLVTGSFYLVAELKKKGLV